MAEELWATSESSTSGRRAIVALEHDSVWLYLTVAGGDEIAADCWLWNTGPALTGEAWQRKAAAAHERQGPPPAPAEVLAPDAIAGRTERPEAFGFIWAEDGERIGVTADGVLVGIADAGSPRGFSAGLAIECPWGRPLDPAMEAEFL